MKKQFKDLQTGDLLFIKNRRTGIATTEPVMAVSEPRRDDLQPMYERYIVDVTTFEHCFIVNQDRGTAVNNEFIVSTTNITADE